MLAPFRKFSASTTRSVCATCYRRQITSTSVRRDAEVDPPQTEGAPDELPEASPADRSDPTYEAWLDGVGKQFRDPHRPRNWLGGQVVSHSSLNAI